MIDKQTLHFSNVGKTHEYGGKLYRLEPIEDWEDTCMSCVHGQTDAWTASPCKNMPLCEEAKAEGLTWVKVDD